MERSVKELLKNLHKAVPLTVAREMMTHATPQAFLLRYYWWESRWVFTQQLHHFLARRALAANLCVVLGALALERGEPSSAEGALEQALEVCGELGGVNCTGRPLAQYYLGNIKAAQQ